MDKKYISDYINIESIDKSSFNIIHSGTGTGKSYWVMNNLNRDFPNIKNSEIMFITSRAITVDQQAKADGVSKYNPYSVSVKHWNGEKDFTRVLEHKGIQIMTYDKIVNILDTKNDVSRETLSRVKLIIFDEAHILYSDTFMKGMLALRVWIMKTLELSNKIIIGMTATPNILHYYKSQWGIKLNEITTEPIFNYKAKQLHCTDFKTLPYIINTQLEGRTIVMCYSLSDCKKLKDELTNAFILTSKHNKEYTIEMDRVRQYIVDNESLPEKFIDNDGIEKDLDVLITTSALREGINLREKSGVRNVICCFSDELHVTQFAGRCRYDIDNLIVAYTYIYNDKYNDNVEDDYLTTCRKHFKKYVYSTKPVLPWFKVIEDIIEHDIYKVMKFTINNDMERFTKYINKKWLVPKGIIGKELNKYKIYKKEDKQEIIDIACKCNILGLFPSDTTFKKCLYKMENTLGYTIENKRSKVDNVRCTYKLIVDLDEEKVTKKPE